MSSSPGFVVPSIDVELEHIPAIGLRVSRVALGTISPRV